MHLPSLRQLQAFRSLLRTRSVTETARQLNVSQPAVSKMLLSLEEKLGGKLFNRVGRRLYPIRGAEVISSDVEQIFVHIDALALEMKKSRYDQYDKISIASIPTLSSSVIAPCLSDFLAENQNISAKIISQDFSGVLELVSLMQVDLGFMYSYPGRSEVFNAEMIAELEVVAVFQSDHPLVSVDVVTPAALVDYPVILWEPLTPTGRMVRHVFLEHGVIPQIIIETNNSIISRQMSALGKGVALLDSPTAYQCEAIASLEVRVFRPRIPLRLFCLRSIGSDRSPLSEKFVKILRTRLACPPEEWSSLS